MGHGCFVGKRGPDPSVLCSPLFLLFCFCFRLFCFSFARFLFVNARVFCRSEFTDAVDGVELGFFAFMRMSVNHAHVVGPLAAPVSLCPFCKEVQVLFPPTRGGRNCERSCLSQPPFDRVAHASSDLRRLEGDTHARLTRCVSSVPEGRLGSVWTVVRTERGLSVLCFQRRLG